MDVFGIKKIYQDKPGGPQWDALHWSNGKSRTVKPGSRDTYDPTGCTDNRGNVNWTIDGKGQLLFNVTSSGLTQPRFHLDDTSKYFFKDVEATVYMMRVSDNNTGYGGITTGFRSSVYGHSLPQDYCEAHTYYTRIRFDSSGCDIVKEDSHPNEKAYASAKVKWPSGTSFPKNKWIGYKGVCYNSGNSVKFEIYYDLTDGKNGGDWKLLLSSADTGKWTALPNKPPCSGHDLNAVFLEGGGVVILRNTGVSDARYKKYSVREINPVKYEEFDCSIPPLIEYNLEDQKDEGDQDGENNKESNDQCQCGEVDFNVDDELITQIDTQSEDGWCNLI